eukprot:TRINITY_DN150_c0_g1_i7.p3 TRINITY_DN150_c0_g1~~TRINITY_DN150_c0_g1_i7.p3  ORF type:complete len:105 (-),score=19.89 TRINITY_DN150_c0_g1_i7:567-881(-)
MAKLSSIPMNDNTTVDLEKFLLTLHTYHSSKLQGSPFSLKDVDVYVKTGFIYDQPIEAALSEAAFTRYSDMRLSFDIARNANCRVVVPHAQRYSWRTTGAVSTA